jgi:UPF0755 protein
MRWIWIVAVLVVFVVPVGGLLAYEHLLGAPSDKEKRQLVVIEPGSGVSLIANQLESHGLLRNAQAFSLWVRLKGWDRSIKAGVYAIAPNMGARRVATLMFSGQGESERVTVPEGYSLRQIASALEADKAGSGEVFLDLTAHATEFEADFPWLRELPQGASLEGFLFPDTYVIGVGAANERDLVRMMLARFAQVVMPAYDARPSGHSLSLAQTVTLASIVEKEARHAEERPTIAGVFFNRLATRMPFGSDPTVEYVLQKHQGAKGLSFKDVAVDSPYNTYKYPGLPPGPIANPGLASIKAVLAPSKTSYLYFVARGDGTHAFTKTYAEHLAAQRAILSGRR